MTNNKQGILAILTFVALLTLLGIQVSWIFRTAKLEEKNFNRMVTMALIDAREEIGNSASTCNDMKDYLCGNPCQLNVRKQKIGELDSIIRSKLEIYHINLEYTFEITDSTFIPPTAKLFGPKCYLQSLNGLLEKEGIKIRLEFPDRNQFLLAQIRGQFLISLIAVLFVMFSFFLTSRMFRKEREMVQHTTDFINNMVHEFQTPLANIRFATNLVKKKEDSINDEKVSEYLNVILNENQKMERNVEEILKVSYLNNNAYEPEEVDVNDIIEKTCKEFSARVESLTGYIKTDLQASVSVIQAAPEHVRLIFINLIDNAIKYSHQKPELTLSTKNNNGWIEIKVADKGIGMEKKELLKIFDKYYRVSTGDVHNVKGFGLGLTFVKTLIERYKGRIEVQSTPGKGTVFTINLPL